MPGTSHDAHHYGHGAGAPSGTTATRAPGGHSVVALAIPTGRLACEGCATCVEERLREHPHVVGVHVDGQHGVAHVTIHEGMVTADELAETVAAACGDRSVVPLPKPQVSSHAHAHTARPEAAQGAGHGSAPTASADRHAAHGMVAPASLTDHLGHGPPPDARREAMDHAAMDHAAMGHGAHGTHDMSDPRMAAAMEADMRRRFWISLVLAIPVVLYSPMAMMFGLQLPTPFGIPHDWIMLLFATPVALWTSSVFHVGAYYSLRSRVLNMSVLVSLN